MPESVNPTNVTTAGGTLTAWSVSYFCQTCRHWITGRCDHEALLARIADLETQLAAALAAGRAS